MNLAASVTRSSDGWSLSVTEPRRRPAATTADRFGRMLVVVPYLVRHPGSRLDEVATLFSIPEPALRRDLDLLFMSGLPPYGPGDLIEVDVDEDGRVWIAMADHFSRPLRLTRAEALTLYLRGAELLATPGIPEAPSLTNALDALGRSLGPEAVDARSRIETIPGNAPRHLAEVREAAGRHQTLRLKYHAASTGMTGTRTIDPEEVFSSMGHWYVAAWDREADAERLFRVDRILEATSTGDTFMPRGLEGAGRALYTPADDDVEVRLRLHRDARWIAEYYVTTEAVEGEDGTLDIAMPVGRLEWLARLLLRLGHDVEVLSPPELMEQVRELAERTLARYRDDQADLARSG